MTLLVYIFAFGLQTAHASNCDTWTPEEAKEYLTNNPKSADFCLVDAARENNFSVVKVALEFGANPNTDGGPYFGSAIGSALNVKNLEMFQVLIGAGAKIDHVYYNCVALSGIWDACIKLLMLAPYKEFAEVALDTSGFESLENALKVSLRHNLKYSKKLINEGVTLEPNGESNPTFWAAYHANEEILKLLVSKGASLGREGVVEYKDGNCKMSGYSPGLYFAAKNSNLSLAQTLLSLGDKDTNWSIVEAYTGSVYPVSVAAAEGSTEVLALLLKSNFKLRYMNTSCGALSPLHLAAANGHLHAVQLLVIQGMDVNEGVKSKCITEEGNLFACGIGETPLALAIKFGYKEVASYLTSVGGK